jgi:hypothetical protein
MVSEKVAALAHVTRQVMQGSYGLTPQSIASGIFSHYASVVRANRRRLSKSPKRAQSRRIESAEWKHSTFKSTGSRRTSPNRLDR